MKICTKCGARKRSNGFYTNERTKDGLRSECKDCSKESTKRLRLRKRGLTIEQRKYDKAAVSLLDSTIKGLQALREKMVTE